MQVVFDMDGTIADLYSVEDWEEKLNASDPTPYIECKPLIDMQELRKTLIAFQALGGIVSIVSWSAMNGSKEYNKEVKKAKVQWCKKYNMPVDNFHVVKYGTKKWYPLKDRKHCILFDDNADVRRAFQDEENDRQAFSEKEIIAQIQNFIEILKQNFQKETAALIEQSYEEKTMAYCFKAWDTKNQEDVIKVGMTTTGEKRILDYCRQHNYAKVKVLCCYPVVCAKDAYAMEDALHFYMHTKSQAYRRNDRFYECEEITPLDFVGEDSFLMQCYHQLGY